MGDWLLGQQETPKPYFVNNRNINDDFEHIESLMEDTLTRSHVKRNMLFYLNDFFPLLNRSHNIKWILISWNLWYKFQSLTSSSMKSGSSTER